MPVLACQLGAREIRDHTLGLAARLTSSQRGTFTCTSVPPAKLRRWDKMIGLAETLWLS
jgi:hypothetical protein